MQIRMAPGLEQERPPQMIEVPLRIRLPLDHGSSPQQRHSPQNQTQGLAPGMGIHRFHLQPMGRNRPLMQSGEWEEVMIGHAGFKNALGSRESSGSPLVGKRRPHPALQTITACQHLLQRCFP